ncbi:hypothetical protein EVJ58_g6673 [Rhodofomes roseus]|uniref:ASST-domain-containing protein n=1 Tax=Rhodofomes roseus TaxID=34475 RepID=A0A4Y9Y747_9APHY|nr:hypothetical protein EVJ58_g6673 [Rhodofomes roseus]
MQLFPSPPLALLALSATVARAQELLSFRSRPDLQPLKWIVAKEPTENYHDGYYMTCPWSTDVPQPAPAIYTSKGDLVWTDPEVGMCFDLDVQNLNGTDVLTFWNGTVNPFSRYGIGQAYIMDSTYAVTHVLATTFNDTCDLHEFTIPKVTNSTALLPVYWPVQADLSDYGGTEDGWVLYNFFQEIDIATGEIVFEWNFRINSIDKDTSGNYLVSSGHTQALYYIDGTDGEIIWKLGGKNSSFTFGLNATFYGQQDARFVDGPTVVSMHVGEATTGQTTERGLSLLLNTTTMEATMLVEFLPLTPYTSTSQGSLRYDPDGNVVFGGGTNPWISEYLPNGTMIYSAALGGEGLVDSLIENYRSLKTTTWIGYPQTAPDIAFNGSTVWASWNGATEVAEWEILTGAHPSILRPVAVVPKDGFETEITIDSAKYARARAYDAWGAVLGQSHVLDANSTIVSTDGQYLKRSEIDGRVVQK